MHLHTDGHRKACTPLPAHTHRCAQTLAQTHTHMQTQVRADTYTHASMHAPTHSRTWVLRCRESEDGCSDGRRGVHGRCRRYSVHQRINLRFQNSGIVQHRRIHCDPAWGDQHIGYQLRLVSTGMTSISALRTVVLFNNDGSSA